MGYCKRCGDYFPTLTNSSDVCPRCACGMIPKPVTNADRIRSMTDDELAVFLCDINGCYFSLPCPGDKLCTKGDGKANGLKKWLKQPCEDSPTAEKG